jgi:hypothetical protein
VGITVQTISSKRLSPTSSALGCLFLLYLTRKRMMKKVTHRRKSTDTPVSIRKEISIFPEVFDGPKNMIAFLYYYYLS